ncbi:MAG: AAA family ATPase [Pleurocapsa sp. MO_192.B19]|nr:AAA family ATPase [Pleurocapsa sp. MO_192.B19]
MEKLTSKVKRHWKSLLLFNLILVGAVIGKVTISPKTWDAKAQLILPNTSGNLDADLGTLGSLKNSGVNFSSSMDPLLAQESILISNPVLKQVLDSDPEKELFSSVSGYKKFFEVLLAENSNTFNLNVTASSPELARQRTANWIKAYQERLNQLRQADNQSRQQFQTNQKQIEEAKENLAKAERELADFEQNSRLISSEEQVKGMVKVVGDLTSLQEQAKAKAQANQKQIAAISQRLGLTPDEAIRSLSLGENKDYQFLRNKLVEIESTLNGLQANFTNEDPRIQSLLLEREELKHQLQQYVDNAGEEVQIDSTVSNDGQGRASLIQQLVLLESEAEASQKQAEQLESQIEQINVKLESIPQNRSQLSKLKRQKDIAEGVYQGLIAQVQQAGINSFDTYPNVQVIDPPEADSQPSSHNSQLIILGSLLTSFVGSTALLLLLENSDPLLDAKDLHSSNFPFVVCIPKFKNSDFTLNLPHYAEVEFEKLASAIASQTKITNPTLGSKLLSAAEELESTQLELISIDSPPKQSHRLLITSAETGEGKTSATIGIGQALANLGHRVLMVDADYHKAELSRHFNYNPEIQSNFKHPVHVEANLDLLVTQSPEAGKTIALVSQGQFDGRLRAAELSGNYDYVLVDTSPVSVTSEAVIMTSMISDILFVVRPGISKRNSVNSSLDQLTQNKSRILGLVVNGVKKNTEQYSYSTYSTRSNYLLTSEAEAT